MGERRDKLCRNACLAVGKEEIFLRENIQAWIMLSCVVLLDLQYIFTNYIPTCSLKHLHFMPSFPLLTPFLRREQPSAGMHSVLQKSSCIR
jgi:hypothetical protein